METQTEPTLETQVHGQPFLVTGDEQSIIDMAESLRKQQRVELATHIGRELVMAPVRATKVLLTGIGRAVAHNVHEAYEDWELREHDARYNTNLYERKQRQLIEARTQRLVQKVGL